MKDTIKEIPFSGKLVTAEPASIGTNFRTLTNMRYTDTHIRGISGMTKINTSVMNATYLKTRNAFHFKKAQPSESHVIAQAYDAGLTASALLDNMTAIPSAGAFSATALWSDSAGAGLGRFSDAPDGQMVYANGVDTCMWGGNETKCGALIQTTVALSAASDALTSPKDATDFINNTKTDAANVISVVTSAYTTFIVGATRPAKGAKIYVASANTSANTLTVKESTAGDWNALTVTADNTAAAGASFAQTGSITWASTVATTKPKYLAGYYLYWYQFSVDACDGTISHITLDLPMQGIIDMWDGTYRDISKFYTTIGSRRDDSTKALVKDFDATSAATYVAMSSFTTGSYVEIGFGEKMTGLFIEVPAGHNNDNAADVTVSYWDGSAYATVGTVSDGTKVGTYALGNSGVISWNNTSIASEQKQQIANSEPLYFYKLIWSNTLGTVTKIDYAGGITASKPISNYKFPVFAQGRILLCCDMSEDKNKAVCSSKYMPQSYNGDDSVDIYFGEEGELTCGTELFSQFGSSLYSLVLMFKDHETWVLAGQDINQWADNTFLLSSSVGCPAPLTLKTINLHAEPGAGVNRALAIWQGGNGIYMSDGRAPIPIHGDIKEYFDPRDSRCIKSSMIGDSVGFVDPVDQHYHWLFASGTAATTLNKELVYDIARNRWFEIDRSADLQCGVTVYDTDGNGYTYGFLDTGYMERLEYGTTFDGTDITHTIQYGDMPLGGLGVETRLSRLRLITVAKAVTVNNVEFTHYPNTSSTGTAYNLSPANSGYRIAEPELDSKLNGDPFHSFKFVMITDDETIGFEPIAAVVAFNSVEA